jgi:lipoate-protein ligase A
MAADETLLRSAAHGTASLRFYGWRAATLSLGYFQPCTVRLAERPWAVLPWVRRPSGGATLVHHHELTYALALPAGARWQSGPSWLLRMHRIIEAALAELGLAEFPDSNQISPTKPITFSFRSSVSDPRGSECEVLCFHQFTFGDLLCAGRKVVGSAQRKHRQALMQHGSILLAQSEHAPSLPGIREIAGVVVPTSQMQKSILQSFVKETGWGAELDEWSEQEKMCIEELVGGKYATAAWNEKR